ncbi:flavocytochrome c [Poronia punctata]|nr:flavocytochrome c [Poronia punctata]
MARPVITVGSGLAGLSAAYEALKTGAKVHMLERAPKPGGNSIKASSGISAAGTKFQDAGDDDVTAFYEDSVRSAGTRLNNNTTERLALIQLLTSRSAEAISWLADDIGVDLSLVAQLGGHSAPRTHRGAAGPPPGFAIVNALLRKLGDDERFTLTCSADVKALTFSEAGRVDGVRYALADGSVQHEVRGPVIFAAGGFAGDAHGLLAKYRPDLAGLPSTNDARPASSHDLLAGVGAELVDMDSVQVHPTGFVDPRDPGNVYKFLAAEALRGEGGILLDGQGKRFVNEMERRDVVSEAIMKLDMSRSEKDKDGDGDEDGGVKQWDVMLLLDPGAAQAAKSHVGFYLSKGLLQKKKVKDLPRQVIASIDEYAEAVKRGKDEKFGRRYFGHWTLSPGEGNREEEMFVGKVTPVSHFTMGGVAFNTKAQVLGKGGVPVEGVWAAGEITGGLHGDNRLGGNSLLECAIFGRIAGAEAAKSCLGT